MHHRDVRDNAGSTTVSFMSRGHAQSCISRQTNVRRTCKDGDADRGHWVTELTLEVLEEKADLSVLGYNQNG